MRQPRLQMRTSHGATEVHASPRKAIGKRLCSKQFMPVAPRYLLQHPRHLNIGQGASILPYGTTGVCRRRFSPRLSQHRGFSSAVEQLGADHLLRPTCMCRRLKALFVIRIGAGLERGWVNNVLGRVHLQLGGGSREKRRTGVNGRIFASIARNG